MINILNFYEAGKARSGSVLIPFFDTVNISFWRFSTRHGNAKVKWGDGNETDYVLEKNIDLTSGGIGTSMSHTYATGYTGDVEVIFKQGLKDVYSVDVVYWGSPAQTNKINIQDFGTYIKKFKNLYSYLIETYAYQVTANMPIIKGDLADIPASVEIIKISSFEILNNETDVWFNFNSLPAGSKLKFLDFSGEAGAINATKRKILGNLANLPVGCTFCRINRITSNSAITYTAGKVWASSFDTLNIPLVLTTSELDNLLIDMNNSITTKIGAGVIYIGGYRSSVSDAAVASLQAKGFTVNINRFLNNVSNADSALLRLDFQNNFDVYSNSGLNIIAGGTSNQPTFALSGRKPGEYCAVFNGSQSIKTTTNLPVNSDKITIAFWMKTTQTTAGYISELSASVDANNAFLVAINNGGQANKIQAWSRNSGYNNITNPTTINDGVWRHFVAVIDRNQNGANEIKFYENGNLMTVTKQFSADNSGNFANKILFIGQRAGSTSAFNGSLTKLKLYNYPLTAGEVSTLYNSEL